MMKWLAVLKDYWGIGLALVGVLILWGSLPERVKRVEAGQAKQEEKVSEVREWIKETQGLLKGQAILNERMAQQTANAPPRPTWRWTEWDEDICWGCNADTREDCWTADRKGRNAWRRCE